LGEGVFCGLDVGAICKFVSDIGERN
jgi:hypothetical protein